MRQRILLAKRLLLAAALFYFGTAAVSAEECRGLTRMKLAHAVVTDAAVVAAGTAVSVPAGGGPVAGVDMCRIQVTSKPTPDSDIRFELWVPAGSAWNGKFEQVGNGGFAGSLPYTLMARIMALGYAVAGTDDGHQSHDMTDASWAADHPERIKDFGWRAIDETARDSKRILRRLTAKPPVKSYFIGCSDGGREALMMAQRFPAYFDGIIAGAPASSMTRLLTGGAVRSHALQSGFAHFSKAELALLQQRALQACGNGASYLTDPRTCHVDLDSLQCGAAPAGTCLTAAQIETARVIYSEREDPADGSVLYGVMPGAEAVPGSWDDWLTGTDDKTPPAGIAFTWNYLAYLVMKDPKLDMAKVTTADLTRGERTIGPIIDANDADLSAFKAHGGKLLQYHGWNDPAIPPGYSLDYQRRVTAKTAGARDFYRLYMVPGMLHCRGGDAPTQVDWQGALEAWVEKGRPPADLSATDGKGATQVLHPVD